MVLLCPRCKSTRVRKLTEDYHYTESGLDYVYLRGLDYVSCEACGEEGVGEIPNVGELHEEIGLFLVMNDSRLGGAELKFLRKVFGWTQEEMARRTGVSRITVIRWERQRKRIDQAVDALTRVVWTNTLLKRRLARYGEALNPDLRERLRNFACGVDTVMDFLKEDLTRICVECDEGEFHLMAA